MHRTANHRFSSTGNPQGNAMCATMSKTVIAFVIKVIYPDGSEVNLGNVLTPTVVKPQPLVSWPYEDSQLYTLTFFDPDAPSRAEPDANGQRKHWIVVNIKQNNLSTGITQASVSASCATSSGANGAIVLCRAVSWLWSIAGHWTTPLRICGGHT